ncbi:hypothetical protein [Kordia sp.]|uniref:hypothetical protein n=1 Tax=Kordia sp. TaxID=1965332 RepID=UPI003D2CAEF4
MKKRNLKVLKLNKSSISKLESDALKGEYGSNNRLCYSEQVGTCYWLDCPFPESRRPTLCCD